MIIVIIIIVIIINIIILLLRPLHYLSMDVPQNPQNLHSNCEGPYVFSLHGRPFSAEQRISQEPTLIITQTLTLNP